MQASQFPMKTVLIMITFYTGVLSVAAMISPELRKLQTSTLLFWALAIVVKCFYLILAFSNPGYIEHIDSPDSLYASSVSNKVSDFHSPKKATTFR